VAKFSVTSRSIDLLATVSGYEEREYDANVKLCFNSTGSYKNMGKGRGVYRVLVGRPEGKRPLGIPRRRWEDNMKLDLREIGIDGANWIQMAQDMVQWRAFVNTVMNFGFHKESRIFFDKLSDSKLFK
jgi:hypothetical protein